MTNTQLLTTAWWRFMLLLSDDALAEIHEQMLVAAPNSDAFHALRTTYVRESEMRRELVERIGAYAPMDYVELVAWIVGVWFVALLVFIAWGAS